MGERNGRWAMVIDKDGTVTYAENESNPSQVTVRTTLQKETSTILTKRRSLVLIPFLQSCEMLKESLTSWRFS
jgi:hypothetical protein